MKWLIFIISFIFLTGCGCPKKFKVSKKEEKPGKIESEEVPAVKERQEGKATYEETKKAMEGEGVPQSKIPAGKKFVRPEGIGEKEKVIFQPIYFDFDKYNLKPAAQKILDKIGDYLLENTDKLMIIEGHCDERGTREYNLVLGEQRALSARRYLIIKGVSPKRIFTVSYGEDRPADPRHCEEAWEKNRRCEFLISKD